MIDPVSGDLFLNVGIKRILIPCNAVTVRKTREIRDAMTKVKAKHSAYDKVPRDPKETGEQWNEKYLEYISKINIRQPGEDLEAYKLRVLSPTALEDDMEYLADVLIALANLFNSQGDIITKTVLNEDGSVKTEGTFEEIVLEEACGFIVRLLKKAKYPTSEFEMKS